MPRAEANIASVAMNGTILPYAISTPLISPQAAPTTTAANTIAIQPMSSAIAWVPVVVAQTDASATIAPTDRSMPPPVMTKVMPTATTPRTAARRRIVTMLSVLANRSPLVATADDAQHDQCDDQSEVAGDSE